MFRLALLLVGVAICQATAGPKPEFAGPRTRLFGFPWINPTLIASTGSRATTVTTTVQVPLYIVRTTTVVRENGGATTLPGSAKAPHTVYQPSYINSRENGGASTLYRPGPNQGLSTVVQPSYIYSTLPGVCGSGTRTIYVTSYFPFTVTVNAAQQLVAIETVSQFVDPSQFAVTRTAIKDCASTITTTRMRTSTRTDYHTIAYLVAGKGSTVVSLTETQNIPSHYLKF